MKKGKYIANQDLKNTLYTFNLGGGISGRTVKKDDVVTVIGEENDITSNSVKCIELLHRMESTAFSKLFTIIEVNPEVISYAEKHGKKAAFLFNNRLFAFSINPSELRKAEYEVNRNYLISLK